MVGLVLVSHSLALASALKETLAKLYADKTPPVAVAAGAGDGGAELGTDATAIMAAIEEAGAPGDGVLVLLDLGSAILSAELALDLLDESQRENVALCPAPLVEGAIAAAAQSSIGATLAEVRAEAENALRQKVEHLGAAPPPVERADKSSEPDASVTLTVENPHGLHARPAMKIVQTAARFASVVEIENLRTGAPASSARSLVAINCLDARLGDTIRVTARGPDAAEALRALEALHAEQFGDLADEPDVGKSIVPEAADDRFPHGRSLSGGIALGPLFYAGSLETTLPPSVAPVEPDAELARLHRALGAVRTQLETEAATLTVRLGAENAAILQAHRALADDPTLIDRAEAIIRHGQLPATHAWQQSSRLAAEAYRRLEQPLLRERAGDVEDLNQRVLRELGVVSAGRLDHLPDTPHILAVSALLPSEVAALDPQKTVGIIADSIGPTSHAAILLRAANIAVVDGVDLTRLHVTVAADTIVALDGGTGEVWLAPDETTTATLAARLQPAAVPALTYDATHRPPPLHTSDGRRVELAANVTSAADAAAATRAGAEAIGLLRTEFLFSERREAPTEDEQAEALRRIITAMPPGAPITVRTFDIGGDKPAPYLPVPAEANPFLGMRGLRLALIHRALFLVHLRAILRAAHGQRVRVMFPMVTEVEEVRRARTLLAEAHTGLAHAGVAHAWPVEVGMMVEVPAAALNVDSFVEDVNFFSIGTNDLTQYTLAAERGHAQLANFADALHPAVLRLVGRVATVAARNGKWTGVCGEAAADPVAAEVFVGLGINELSVGTAALGKTRQSVGAFHYQPLRQRARRCLQAESAAEVRRLWSAQTGEI